MSRALLDVEALVARLDAGAIDRRCLHGPRQVTDAHRLALAVAHDDRFATLDGGVPLSAVVGAETRLLVVI